MLSGRDADVDDDGNERGRWHGKLVGAGIDAVEDEVALGVAGGVTNGGSAGVQQRNVSARDGSPLGIEDFSGDAASRRLSPQDGTSQ